MGVAFLFCSLIALAIPFSGSNATAARPDNFAVSMDNLTSEAGWVAAHHGPSTLDLRPAMQLRTEPVAFTLHENGLATSRTAIGATVADALGEAGVVLNAVDIVSPAGGTPLEPGVHIFVRYAKRLVVRTGGQQTTVYTQANEVGDALTRAGILEQTDFVTPDRGAPVRNGMAVELTTVREKTQSDDIPIPHDTVYHYDNTLNGGTQVVTQPGADGYVRKDYLVKQINGLEIERKPLDETTVQPTPEIVSIGTYNAATAVPQPAATAGTAPDGSQCAQTVTVWSTYYTAASAGGTRTATGTGVYKGIIAVDPRFIPLGSRMYVPGYGYGIAADTGGGVKGWWLDLAYGTDDAYDWWSHYVEVCILA